MPFIAYDPEKDQRVNIFDYRRPKEALAGRKLVCPYYYELCGKEIEMHVRYRKGYQDHFVHNNHCPYTELHGRESLRHLVAKAAVRALLRRDPLWKAADFHLEKWVPEAERLADVLAVFPDGTQIAHECQLSSITWNAFRERTASYEAAGVGVFWWIPDWRWRHRINLRRQIYRHHGLGLTLTLREGPNPYRDGAEHRRCHSWPERLTLWARRKKADSSRQRLLTTRIRFSQPEQPAGEGANDRFARLSIRVPRLDIELRKRIWQHMLWSPVQRVLKAAETWRRTREIYDRLAPCWRRHFQPEDVGSLLSRRFLMRGDIAPGPQGGWLPRYLPGLSIRNWRHWWSTRKPESPEGVNPGYLVAARFHRQWWARRLRGAYSPKKLRQVWHDVRTFELYPQVREDLRSLYEERLKELEGRS